MGSQRIVTGPVVVLPDANTGKTGYFYQGSVLPDGLDEDRVQACIADGLVSEDKKAEELTVEDLSAVAAGDRLRAASREVAPARDESGNGAPPKAAAKEAWVDFAVAQGATREDAEKATKQELIDAYGA